MRVRALDGDGDWTFGSGQNDYKAANAAVAQNIQTRLGSFLGDCFFDIGAGIDWFTFLGGKDALSLNLAISAVIINTLNVTGLLELSVNLNEMTRNINVIYRVQTTFSQVSGTFQYDLGGSI